MISNKDRYNYESRCGSCGWVSKPSVWRLGVAIAPNPDIDRHPEIKLGKVWYDEKGRKHTILGRLQIVGKHVRVFCPECGKQCRSGSISKTPAKNHYEKSDKPVGRPPTSDKEEINELADIIKQSENTMFEPTLEGVSSHKQSKAKKRLKKNNETKTSHVT